jgi:hypothetical protein
VTRNDAPYAPFFCAAVVALVTLLMIAPVATHGGTWRYLEYPRYISILALVITTVAMFRRGSALAIATPFLVAGIAFGWELVDEWRGLAKFGKTDLIWTELDVLATYTIKRVAPWLVGGLGGALAYLSVTRSRITKQNFIRAGAWLVVLAGVCLAITLANDGWTYHDSDGLTHDYSPWPPPQKRALVTVIITGVIGLAAIGFGFKRDKSPLPEARVVR